MDKTVNILDALLDHNIYIIDVKAPSRDVRGDKDHAGPRPSKLVKNVKSGILHQVPVQASESGVRLSLIVLHFLLCLAEDQDFELRVAIDELSNILQLGFAILAEDDLVADSVWHLGCVFANQINHEWVLHVLSCDLLDVLRDRGRKDHGLGLRHVALYFHYVMLEAHVEHFVAFVQNLKLRTVDVKSIVLKQVNKAPRRRHNYLRSDSSYVRH